MNEYLLTAIFTLLLGAGNSIYHADRLTRIGEARDHANEIGVTRVTDIMKVIFGPPIIYFGYLLVKANIWLFFLAIVFNLAPLNAVTILVANIVVVPLATVIAKILKVEL